MTTVTPPKRTTVAGLPWSRLALAAAIALGYAAEVLFQPDVFTAYAASAVALAVGSIFLEVMCAGVAVVVVVAYVNQHAAKKARAR